MMNYGSKESFIFLNQVTRGALPDEEIGQAWMMRYGLGNRVEPDTFHREGKRQWVHSTLPYNRGSSTEAAAG